MNTKKTFPVIVIVALLLNACEYPSTPTLPVAPGITPLPKSVGILSAEEKLVESGASDNLAPVTNTADFFDNDTVRVTNGGIATLELFTDQIDNKISIRIFNDTAIGDVKVDPSKNEPFVTLLLVFGGLTGEVPKNGRLPAQFTTPNGVNIYILGTQFMVLFDPETSTTYIGNFDGTVAYSIPGQSVQFTQAGQLYEVSSNFEIKQSTLNFTRADIESLASSTRSRLLDVLEDYLAPTATPTPTTTPAPTLTPTITPTSTKIIPCNKAAFVSDVTVPDGTSFSPGFQFTKVWRLKNVGTCTWTASYSLDFYRGEQMGGLTSVNIPSTVAPGQTVDVSVGLVALAVPGSYRGDWMLRSSSGALFGVGVNGTTAIWVKINVISTPTPTNTPSPTPSSTPGGLACPYVYTEDPATGEWEFQTTILYKLVDHESAQQRYLAQFNGKLLIREEESEISYLNRLYVLAKMSDGSTRILEPDVEELKHEDNGYIILHQGEEILISFHDYPITGQISQWWVMAVGYYSPLR